MIKKLKFQYLRNDIKEKINELSINNYIENNLFDIIDEIVDEFDDEIYVILEFDEIIDELNIKELFKNFMYENLIVDDKLNYKYYDELIELNNVYTNDLIVENDIDEFFNDYGIKLNFNDFISYRSDDDLIYYNSSTDNYMTINYYDLDEKIVLDDIIRNIMTFKGMI